MRQKKKKARFVETTSVGPVCLMASIGVDTESYRGMARLVKTGSHTLLKGVN
jgi:hypothetical protein